MESTLYCLKDLQSTGHLREKLAKANGAFGSLVRIYNDKKKFWLKPDGKERTKIEDEAGIFTFEKAWEQHKHESYGWDIWFEALEDPIHPGIYINKVLLPAAKLSQNKLAKQTGLSSSLINHVLMGAGGLTARTAGILGNHLGVSPLALLSQQNYHDLCKCGHKIDYPQPISPEQDGRKDSDNATARGSDGNEKTVIQTPITTAAPADNSLSIVGKVLQDLAAGSLRFALIGTSDGGVEIWRAPAPTPPPAPTVQEIEALVCNAITARKILGGISTSSLWKLEKRGIVKRLPNFPNAHYSIEHLKTVIAANASLKVTTKWKSVQ